MTMQGYKVPGVFPMKDVNPVIVSMPQHQLDDDIVLSTFNLHFCNPCCLGFGAFYNSVKARDSRLLGDFSSARRYGTRARRLNISSIIIGFLLLVLVVVILVKNFSQINSHLSN